MHNRNPFRYTTGFAIFPRISHRPVEHRANNSSTKTTRVESTRRHGGVWEGPAKKTWQCDAEQAFLFGAPAGGAKYFLVAPVLRVSDPRARERGTAQVGLGIGLSDS
jgi:hypothetical protein